MKLYTEIETESSWILTSNRPQRCVHLRTGEKWERGEVMAREVEREGERGRRLGEGRERDRRQMRVKRRMMYIQRVWVGRER